ncbi:hypothetical protein BDK51DRAFT_28842 [Blyttiomyces helicus]|uniref:Uncharacterized protein n=1 Tax=Blyttiomyces helicus TaxID=388810 RepID=A0A4P9W4D8_9FUNG|nr:hypothetical protein BDK51DRAFT_28842 [Blyttiomyces helicus]|eukprot:RKO85550.1 hypothetical protein BDK51DRAFT_28842 [Blyttiomyces helicus]
MFSSPSYSNRGEEYEINDEEYEDEGREIDYESEHTGRTGPFSNYVPTLEYHGKCNKVVKSRREEEEDIENGVGNKRHAGVGRRSHYRILWTVRDNGIANTRVDMGIPRDFSASLTHTLLRPLPSTLHFHPPPVAYAKEIATVKKEKNKKATTTPSPSKKKKKDIRKTPLLLVAAKKDNSRSNMVASLLSSSRAKLEGWP